MVRASRFRCIALALFLVASHTSFAAHAASHTDSGGLLCQLCLCQAQQSYGLPATAIHFAAPSGSTLHCDDLPAIDWACVVTHAYDGRAPPAIA